VFEQLATGVYLARTQPLDVNVTLVVGSTGALVIDTLSTGAQARALLAAVREITTAPLSVVNTHFHYDHCFGNATFAAEGAPIWGHPATIGELTESAGHWQRAWFQEYTRTDPAFADELAAVEVRPPDRAVREPVRLDLGGQHVTVMHPGRGHTAGDLVVHVEGAGLIVAGDLIEEGAPPDFTDAFPLEWPEAVAAILRLDSATIVPGHGAPVDAAFATAFHGRLSALDWLIRDGHRHGGTIEAVAAQAPWPADAVLPGVRRGYAELDVALP
jgi:glyoxylase-like metal-dependent hydrolase (beta-lactamase superfamily II)